MNIFIIIIIILEAKNLNIFTKIILKNNKYNTKLIKCLNKNIEIDLQKKNIINIFNKIII